MYTIGYNDVQICNKKKILKHGLQNFHRFTKECVKCTLCLYTLWSKNAGSPECAKYFFIRSLLFERFTLVMSDYLIITLKSERIYSDLWVSFTIFPGIILQYELFTLFRVILWVIRVKPRFASCTLAVFFKFYY